MKTTTGGPSETGRIPHCRFEGAAVTDAVAAGPATSRRWASPAAICTAARPGPLGDRRGRHRFTAGIADTLFVTGGIVLAALVAVRLLWPGRR